jgi:hypothetical protein
VLCAHLLRSAGVRVSSSLPRARGRGCCGWPDVCKGSNHLLLTTPATHHITAQHITSRHGTARHITSHHITSQHSTAHHITAQHSTAVQRDRSHKGGSRQLQAIGCCMGGGGLLRVDISAAERYSPRQTTPHYTTDIVQMQKAQAAKQCLRPSAQGRTTLLTSWL